MDNKETLFIKGNFLYYLLIIFTFFISWGWVVNSNAKDIINAAGAGYWFPGDPYELREMVTKFITQAKVDEPGGNVVANITPHAGYTYSGKGAGYSFAVFAKEKYRKKIKRAILLGPSHRSYFHGAAILDADIYRTPLGDIPINREISKKLVKPPLLKIMNKVHTGEHSLENQLPFLQVALPGCSIVMILIGELDYSDYEQIGNALKSVMDDKTILVVSSDFTHFGPSYGYLPFPINKDTRENIEKLDMGAAEKICNLDFDGFYKYMEKTKATICGKNPIGVLLKTLPPSAKGKVVNYYTSSDLTHDFSLSVSYASIIFYLK